jgi:hypothetical protein
MCPPSIQGESDALRELLADVFTPLDEDKDLSALGENGKESAF